MFVRQVLSVACVAGAGSVLIGAVAFAHVDPDPTEAPGGSQQPVGFTVEHGCDGSPTTQLDLRILDGSTSVAPEPPAAWTGSTAGNVVTFTGGRLEADLELTFRVSFVLPSAPGTAVYFPFSQRCGVGEIRWIDVPQGGVTEELDEPAPAMILAASLAAAGATTTPQVSSTTPTDPYSTVSAGAPSATEPVAEVTLSETGSFEASTSTVPSQAGSASGTAGPTITAPPKADPNVGRSVLIGTVLAIAAGAGLMIRQARRGR